VKDQPKTKEDLFSFFEKGGGDVKRFVEKSFETPDDFLDRIRRNEARVFYDERGRPSYESRSVRFILMIGGFRLVEYQRVYWNEDRSQIVGRVEKDAYYTATETLSKGEHPINAAVRLAEEELKLLILPGLLKPIQWRSYPTHTSHESSVYKGWRSYVRQITHWGLSLPTKHEVAAWQREAVVFRDKKKDIHCRWIPEPLPQLFFTSHDVPSTTVELMDLIKKVDSRAH
jgi:hypothetical protein